MTDMERSRLFVVQCPNPHHPVEDAVAEAGNAIGVFDGVTLAHEQPYPDPSPAAAAAQRGVQAAVSYADAHAGEPDCIKEAFRVANEEIAGVNTEFGITPDTVDFLQVQWAAAVGAIAVVHGNVVDFGWINDCGVMVCEADGNVIGNYTTDKTHLGPYLDEVRRERGFQAGSPEAQRFVRSTLVNNPDLVHDGRPMNDYVLTGEAVALRGVQVGRISLSHGMAVITYSDGFIPSLAQADFRRGLLACADSEAAMQYATEARRRDGYTSEASLVMLTVSR